MHLPVCNFVAFTLVLSKGGRHDLTAFRHMQYNAPRTPCNLVSRHLKISSRGLLLRSALQKGMGEVAPDGQSVELLRCLHGQCPDCVITSNVLQTPPQSRSTSP